MAKEKEALIIACPPAAALVKDILSELNTTDTGVVFRPCPTDFVAFPNSEEGAFIQESVRGHHVFLVQCPCAFNGRSVSDTFMQFKLACDALKRASVQSLTGILTAFPFGRQERKGNVRGAITAKLAAREIEVVMGSIPEKLLVSMDLHASAIQGFFDIPFDELTTRTEFAPILVEAGYHVIVAPDVGGCIRGGFLFKLVEEYVAEYRPRVKAEMAMVYKKRLGPDRTEAPWVAGDDAIRGGNVVVVDDILATGDTARGAAKKCRSLGAKKVALAVTFAECCNCDWRLMGPEGPFDDIFITDALPLSRLPKPLPSNWHVVSVAPLLAAAMLEIINCGSVSHLEDRRFPLSVC